MELLSAPTRLLLALLLPALLPANPCEEALDVEPLELEPEEVVVVVLPVLPPDRRWCSADPYCGCCW